jgi:hypothetical protein
MSSIRCFVRGNAGRGPAAALLVSLALLVGGCGGGGSEPEKPTAESLTREGWTAFEAGDFVTASARFSDALALNDQYPVAHVGLGWVEIRTGDFVAARARFDQVTALGASSADANAGEVLVAVGENEPESVRESGAALLLANPNYVFTHDRTYSASDIRWFMARAALEMADYAAVAAQLDVLSPGHGLDPATVTFVERAAALLESLRATV